MKKILVSALMATAMFSAQAEDEIAEAAKASFSGVYFGGGFHFMSYQDYADMLLGGTVISDMENSTKARLGGTILLGIGKKFEAVPFYVALEAGLDFAPNTDLYAKDKADLPEVANYNINTHTVFDQDHAADILNDIVASSAEGLTEGHRYNEVNITNQYSVKIRRNGLNPSLRLRLAWGSDFLKTLVYLGIGAYHTKDKLRYVYHQYAMQSGYQRTVANNGEMGARTFVAGINAEARIEHTGSQEIFHNKICPEVTLGVEKRFGNIGMRIEGGYVFNSSMKAELTGGFTNGNPDSLRFKKKGSCVVRLLGVWNLNLFK